MLTIPLYVVIFLAGGVCGYLLRRNSPETSAKLEEMYKKGLAEGKKIAGK